MYTDEARNKKVTGIITMRLLVGADGTVKRVKIVTGLPDGMSQSARRTAYELRFEPAMKDGVPVGFWTPIHMEFNLK
jgi:TonB family protein